jgi:hypothetical protein
MRGCGSAGFCLRGNSPHRREHALVALKNVMSGIPDRPRQPFLALRVDKAVRENGAARKSP